MAAVESPGLAGVEVVETSPGAMPLRWLQQLLDLLPRKMKSLTISQSHVRANFMELGQ